MKKKIDLFDISMFIFAFGLVILIPIIILIGSKYENESTCVEFYEKHNYILESCEIYRDKLEGK